MQHRKLQVSSERPRIGLRNLSLRFGSTTIGLRVPRTGLRVCTTRSKRTSSDPIPLLNRGKRLRSPILGIRNQEGSKPHSMGAALCMENIHGEEDERYKVRVEQSARA